MLVIVGLIIFFSIVGAIYERVANAQDRRDYPPPGELVDIGGYKLHIYCQGQGSPTVILEAGLDDNSTTWAWIQPEIALQTRVCSYDRAGLGWSEDGPALRDSATIATELKTLLENANIAGPYIMVGHSIGGLHIRQFAHEYPNDVVGMVLVDASHEDQLNRLPPEAGRFLALESTLFAICRITSPLGFNRFFATNENEALPSEVRPVAAALFKQTRYCRSAGQEIKAVEASAAQLRLVGTLDDIPLVVVTAGLGLSDADIKPPGVSEELLQEADRIGEELQKEHLRLSTSSTQLMAEESGHYVQNEQPDIVIQAIELVLESTMP